MKRIEFKEEVLSSLPLPQAGYKTLGVSDSGELSTIDSSGTIEAVGGTGGGGSSFYEQGTVADSINAISVSYPNTTEAANSVVSGGGANTLTSSAVYSNIAGGYGNTTSGSYSTISGYNNKITSNGSCSVIGGGCDNTISGCYSTISGGYCNTESSSYSVISGGSRNTISDAIPFGYVNVIGGGYCNTISARYSGILGGCENNIIGAGFTHSFIIGSDITADRTCTTFVNNLSIKNIPTSAPTQSGAIWSNGGVLTIVP